MTRVWIAAAMGVLSMAALDPAAHAAPPWLAAELPDDAPAPYVSSSVVAVGAHTAIGTLDLHAPGKSRPRAKGSKAPAVAAPYKTRTLAHLGYDPALGARGPLQLPKRTSWVGIGAADAVLAATPDGTLYRAANLDAAVAGTFAKLARVAGAKRWDANAATPIVVATAGRSLWISTDAGATFTRHARPRALDAAFVRADGIVVADRKGTTPEVSRDQGATWTTAPALVGSLVLVRNGNWIGERDHESEITCRTGALAADGSTWVPWLFWHEFPATLTNKWPEVWSEDGLRERWNQRLLDDPDFGTSGLAPATTAADDPMPAAEPEALAAYHAQCKPDHGGGGGLGLLGGSGGSGPSCHGADCVTTTLDIPRHSRLVDAPTLHDGQCQLAPAVAGSPPACTDDESLVRGPTHLLVDLRSGAFAMFPRPAGCVEVMAADLGGAALLACESGDGSDLSLAGLEGVWHAAGHVSGPIGTAKRASDGTIVLTHECRSTARDCVGWLRAPAALDDATATFQRLDVAGGRVYGPVPGGKALVAAVAPAARDDASYAFLDEGPFAISKAADPNRPKALGAKLQKLAECFHALGGNRLPGEVAVHWSRAGTVIDRGPPELAACVRRVVGSLPTTIEPGENTVYFRVGKQAIDLFEVMPGQPPVVIGRALHFDDDLSSVTVDDHGAIELASYRNSPSYHRSVYVVDRASGTVSLKPEPPAAQ